MQRSHRENPTRIITWRTIMSLGFIVGGAACGPDLEASAGRDANPTAATRSIILSRIPPRAEMTWYDGSTLIYDARDGSWKSRDPITLRQFHRCLLADACSRPELLPAETDEEDVLAAPLTDSIAAREYCAFAGASEGAVIGSGMSSGILQGDAPLSTSEVGFSCVFGDPELHPPLCQTQRAYLLTRDSPIVIKSAFCADDVGGVSFDMPEFLTDASNFVVTSDGVRMDCLVTDGRIVCTGFTADTTVSLTVCQSPWKLDQAHIRCLTGYKPGPDGACQYSPVDAQPTAPDACPARMVRDESSGYCIPCALGRVPAEDGRTCVADPSHRVLWELFCPPAGKVGASVACDSDSTLVCPPGYFLDEPAGVCLPADIDRLEQAKSTRQCAAVLRIGPDPGTCRPSACLADSTLDETQQCCQARAGSTVLADSCKDFAVFVPSCED